jgi:hypothetical protein
MTTLPAHTWNVRISRRDQSVYTYTAYEPREPQLHEMVETRIDGRKVRAKIERKTKEPIREGAVGLGVWQIFANEE